MQAAERTTRQLAGTTQFGTGLLLLALCALSAGCGHLPNDVSLIREFQKHRTAIETLRRELTADSEIGTVHPTELVKRGKINSVRKPLEPSLHRREVPHEDANSIFREDHGRRVEDRTRHWRAEVRGCHRLLFTRKQQGSPHYENNRSPDHRLKVLQQNSATTLLAAPQPDKRITLRVEILIPNPHLLALSVAQPEDD